MDECFAYHDPSFEQSGFYKQWLRSYLSDIYGSEEVSLRCLKAACAIYEYTRAEWEADQCQGDHGIVS
jgi:hypothetical protein